MAPSRCLDYGPKSLALAFLNSSAVRAPTECKTANFCSSVAILLAVLLVVLAGFGAGGFLPDPLHCEQEPELFRPPNRIVLPVPAQFVQGLETLLVVPGTLPDPPQPLHLAPGTCPLPNRLWYGSPVPSQSGHRAM